MNIFKGNEKLEKMNKSDVTNMMKDLVNPNRHKGSLHTGTETITVTRKTWRGEWYDYDLTQTYMYEKAGLDMTDSRPTIDGSEYTWGELKQYPAPLLKVLAYRLWQQEKGSEEE